MTGNPEVIAALDRCYTHMLAIEQQAHVQEHWYESTKWCFSKWFDEIEENGHMLVIHKLMKRVNKLGAKLTSQYAFPPAGPRDAEQLEEACADMLERLTQFRLLLIAVCEAAEPANDYKTQSKVWSWIDWTEARMLDFENRIDKIRINGIKMFLQEKM